MKRFIVLLLVCCLGAAVTARPIRGTVKCAGTPVSGVTVTDGHSFTESGADGTFTLDADDDALFISIVTPSGYLAPMEQDIPQFFRPYAASTKRYDFELRPWPATGEVYELLAIGDPQPKTAAHFDRLRTEIIPELRRATALGKQRGTAQAALLLGDIVWDSPELFAGVREQFASLGIPVYGVIGNHDHDLRYPALSNQKVTEESYAERIYEDHFGPYNYSFNVGDAHIITLKDIDYYKDKKYDERFGKEQLEWLKNDLSYVKPGTLVFINVHAPVFNQTDKGGGNAEDAESLKEIVSPYNVHIFAGHTHFFENNQVTPNLYEHNIGAACGAWWAGHVNRCGAPNGYLVVEVKGNAATWYYKATGHDSDYQFRVYRPNEFKSQADYLVVNVWDWDPTYQVTWSENGIEKGRMEQFDDEDQDYIDMHGKPSGYHTSHLFRVRPTDKAKSVKIVATNRFGQSFTQTVDLK